MICKLRFEKADDGNDWIVERYEGINIASTKRYKKVLLNRPTQSDGPILILKAGIVYESENGTVASFEF